MLTQLNPEQLQAVVATNQQVLVLAGAGSGKTRCLTFRIAHSINMGFDPGTIMAVTFTNKAANEMVARLQKMNVQTNRIWVGTFHGLCCRILRKYANNIGFSSAFTIYDADDSKAVIRRIMKSYGMPTEYNEINGIVGKISDWKNKLKSPQFVFNNLPTDGTRLKAEQIAKVYSDYTRELLANHAMDFDDLILRTIQLLELDAHARYWAHNKFQHLLVDEYQDINHSQYVLIQRLLNPVAALWVCGDPDQSIYGWRGADITNILNFQRDYPQAQLCKLERNYRSTKTVVDAADFVVANNKSRLPKKSYTINTAGAPIELVKYYDEREEAMGVASNIVRLIREGNAYNKIAILFRTNAQSKPAERALLEYNIPYTLVGGVSFYQRKEIKDLIAHMQLIANPFDKDVFKRVALLQPGVGAKIVSRVIEISNGDLIDTCINSPNKKINELGYMVKELKDISVLSSPYEVLRQIIVKSDCINTLSADKSTGEERVANVERLLELSKGYHMITEFLSQAALSSTNDKDGPGVKLMTVHGSKGLEFDVVFLIGAEEGTFPHKNSMNDLRTLEEERRGMYVALTRAGNRLFISWVKERYLYGNHVEGKLSRFIKEIPKHYIIATQDAWD